MTNLPSKHLGFVWLFVAAMNTATYLGGSRVGTRMIVLILINLLTAELYLGFIKGILSRLHNWHHTRMEDIRRRKKYDDIMSYSKSGLMTDEELEKALRALVKDEDWSVLNSFEERAGFAKDVMGDDIIWDYSSYPATVRASARGLTAE